MNLYVKPPEFNVDEYLRAGVERRKRLFGKPEKPAPKIEIARIAAPVIPQRFLKQKKPKIERLGDLVYYPKPTEKMLRDEPKEHMLDWYRFLANDVATAKSPIAFVKLQCALHGISYEMLISRGGRKKLFEIRKSIAQLTKGRFPKLSSKRIGQLFQRHHVTILYMLGRLSRSKEDMSAAYWLKKGSEAATSIKREKAVSTKETSRERAIKKFEAKLRASEVWA